MTLSFQGRGEVRLNVDPLEFDGMSQTQVAAELHGMAMAEKNLDYNSEDFFFAADAISHALARRI